MLIALFLLALLLNNKCYCFLFFGPAFFLKKEKELLCFSTNLLFKLKFQITCYAFAAQRKTGLFKMFL